MLNKMKKYHKMLEKCINLVKYGKKLYKKKSFIIHK